jgi:hypothetical protein
MNKYIRLIIILFSFFLTASCQSTRESDKSTGKGISFGSGGGFTGQETEYLLNSDGTLQKKGRFDPEAIVLPAIKRSRAKKLFKQTDVIAFEKISFNHPGNMYYFIRYKISGNIHEVVWGDAAYPVPPEIRQFYESLISTTK